MKHGHDHFGRGPLLLLVGLDRDAAAVVDNRNGIVDVDLHFDILAVSGQGLVDGVIYDLVNEMVEPLGSGASDVHGGPFSDGLQSLQNFDALGRILCFFH